TCPKSLLPPSNSVSRFMAQGEPSSPRGGFTQGCITFPQGTVSDPSGNIWIANTCGGTVTQYPAGNPHHLAVFPIVAGQMANPAPCPAFNGARPFDIAIDAVGDAWVSDNALDTAYKVSAQGTLLATAGAGTSLTKPLAIAIDSQGNVWISSSGVIGVPCA